MAIVDRAAVQVWARTEGLKVSAEGWVAVDRLVGLWLRYGRALNLTGARTVAGLWRQVQEGLAALACAQRWVARGRGGGPVVWVDVGAGGGFPGLVIGATWDCELVLIEPRERRAAFLELALAEIGRAKSRVIRGRIDGSTWGEEVLAGVFAAGKGGSVVLSARAVWGPAEWLERGRRMAVGGGLVLVHGGGEELGMPVVGCAAEVGGVVGFEVGGEVRERG